MAREGKRIRTEHLELRAAASPLPHPRIGLVVPKHKRSVVARNRLKRRLREIIRLRLLAALPAVDLVVRARPEAYGATFESLDAELARAAEWVGRMY
ncbi:MAG: ribonuclease P protein component [Gemmatimonadota bacterium]|nr:ribonuclease P protein component [Gemmatimonadota bacterium]